MGLLKENFPNKINGSFKFPYEFEPDRLDVNIKKRLNYNDIFFFLKISWYCVSTFLFFQENLHILFKKFHSDQRTSEEHCYGKFETN